MADQKPTSTFYNLLGGVNLKASEYSVQKSQFLDIRNMDFDVPNALQKRPGSTQAIGANTSGPINSLFEYIKLNGASYIIAGSNSAMFYLTGTSLTTLSTGWTNGQPTDMLTFVDRLWMANGQLSQSWNGTSVFSYGLPMPGFTQKLRADAGGNNFRGSTNRPIAFFGATLTGFQGATVGTRAILWAAYAWQRADGYISPLDIIDTAQPVSPHYLDTVGTTFPVTGWFGFGYTEGSNYGSVDSFYITGFTSVAPSTYIIGFRLFLALDSFSSVNSNITNVWRDEGTFRSNAGRIQVKSDVNLSLFRDFGFYTLGTLNVTFAAVGLNWTQLTTGQTNFIGSINQFITGSGFSTSHMQFDFFSTFTPKYIEQNQNIYFLSGFSSSPSTLWWSDVGEPEVIQPDYTAEVRTNDGDRITALKTYNNQLIVLKEQSFHKLIGDSSDNFELVELSTEYGCISNQAVVEYKEKLLWLDRKGIVEYNGASWDIISTAVEDIFRRMNLSAAREKAVAVHHLYRNQIWWGIPIDGSSVNNFTVVFDYFVGAWTFFDGFNPASFAFIKGALTQPTVWRGDYSGMIYYHSASFYGDNGVGISCVATPHWEKNKENETWIWRRFFLDVATASGLTGTITGRVYSNYNLSSVQATFSMFQDAFQSRAEIGVVGKAATVEWSHFSASLPLLINGYSWAKRFLRNV